VGLNSDDLVRLCYSHIGPSELLPQRLQLLGIDPEFVRHAAPTTFKDLARVCASCKASRQCARDLARGNVQAGLDGYCLNGLSIDALTVRDGAQFNSLGTGGQHALVDDAPCRAASDSHA